MAGLISWIHSKGWAPGTGGNFSALESDEPLRILITPSGVDKGSVTADSLLLCDGQGSVLEGSGAPSAETLLHLPIYAACRANFVVHTHSIWNTLASLSGGTAFLVDGLEMLKGLTGNSTHRMIERIPILENSQDIPELASELDALLKKQSCHAVLLRGHGMYTWGRSIFEARRHLEVLEFLFEVSLRHQRLDR